MDIGKLVGKLISLGFILGTLGILIAATRAVRDEVTATRRHGIVSLRTFNRQLERGH